MRDLTKCAAVWLLVIGGLIAVGLPGCPKGNGLPQTGAGTISVADISATPATGSEVEDLPFERRTPLVLAVNETIDSLVYIVTPCFGTDDKGKQYATDGAGSGFFVTDDGYIITNYHVISSHDPKAGSILVRTNDGLFDHTARVVATDPAVDLALLKIKTNLFPSKPVRFNKANDVVQGESIFALGAPWRYQSMVTTGIVGKTFQSIYFGPKREDGTHDIFEGAICCALAINPGNSGGPVFNMSGECIGATFCEAGGDGVGFAIPSRLIVERYSMWILNDK